MKVISAELIERLTADGISFVDCRWILRAVGLVGVSVPDTHPPCDSTGFGRRARRYRSAFVILFPALVRLVLTRFRWLFATGDARTAEILALRHQLLVLQRQIGRPRFNNTDRTLLTLLHLIV